MNFLSRLMYSKPKFIVTLVFIVGSSHLLAGDWPCYRGPSADGIIAGSDLLTDWPEDGLHILWSIPFPDDKENTHAGPSVVAGKVYVPRRSGDKDFIFCLDAATGQELWKYSYDAPAFDEVYGTGIRATPTVYKQFVYTLGCFGQLICLDKDTGKLVWRRNLKEDFNARIPSFGMSAAPMVMNGVLICEPGGVGTSVVALEPVTGKEIWRSGNDEASYATPEDVTIQGVRQILAFLSPGLVAFELETGKELWRYEYAEERRKNIPAPIVIGDTIYVSNNTLGFTAIKIDRKLDKWTISKHWSARRERTHYSSPVLGNGCLYYHNGKCEIKCLDFQTGNINWTANGMGTQFGMLIRINESHLLAALDDSEIVLLEVSPSSFKEKARFKALEKAFLQPAIADGKLFARDHDKLTCFDLTRKTIVSSNQKPAEELSGTKPSSRHNRSQGTFTGKLAAFVKLNYRQILIGWLAALTLCVLGVPLTEQGHEFPSIPVIAMASFGSVLVMWLCGATEPVQWKWIHSRNFATLIPILFGLIAVTIHALFRKKQQLVAACTLIVMAILGIVVISNSQMAEVDSGYVLSSAELAATPSAVGDFVVISLIAGVLVSAMYVRMLRGQLDSKIANSRLTSVAIIVLTVVCIGYCVRSTGTLFTIAYTILPAFAVRRICDGWARRLIVAALMGTLSNVFGFLVACFFHKPPSHSAIALTLMFSACSTVSFKNKIFKNEMAPQTDA